MVGQGPVGLSATQLAAAMGARVIALDVSAERLKRAKEFGADALIDPKVDDAIAAIRALTHGAGADRTLDTSGTADGRLIAVRGARPWGVVCFVGEGGDVTIEVSPQCCASSSPSSARGLSPPPSRPTARASSPTTRSTSSTCSPIAGSSTQAEAAYQLFDRQTSGKGVFLM